METQSWNLEIFKKLFENDSNWTLTSYQTAPVHVWKADFNLNDFTVAVFFELNYLPYVRVYFNYKNLHGDAVNTVFSFKEYSSDFHDRINSLIDEYSSGNHS